MIFAKKRIQIDHWQHTTLQYSLQKLQYSGVETIQEIQYCSVEGTKATTAAMPTKMQLKKPTSLNTIPLLSPILSSMCILWQIRIQNLTQGFEVLSGLMVFF